MNAMLNLKLNPIEAAKPVHAEAVAGWMSRLRKRITRYVGVDKDAIFKDPYWPRLWS